LAFSFASFLGLIIIPFGKTFSLKDLAVSQPSDGSMAGPWVSCLVSLWFKSLGFSSGFD